MTMTRGRGRPRSAAADAAILDAALAMFADAGYGGLTVEGVAARAGVGKATIYRRYPTKAALVIAAARSLAQAEAPQPNTGSFADVFLAPWLTPFALSVGVFALTLFAFLAAVYLTLEARDPVERAAFRARALVSGALVGLLAAIVLALAEPDVRSALTASAWAIPLHVTTGASAIAAFVFLWVERYRLARMAAAAQVALILWGWALAQYPYAIRPHLTLAAAAAPTQAGYNPPLTQLDSWLRVNADNTIALLTSEGEVGQGISTGFLMVAAEELDVELGQMIYGNSTRNKNGDPLNSVNDTYAVAQTGGIGGSNSMSRSGPRIRAAAVADGLTT